jgi:hypothetical protein
MRKICRCQHLEVLHQLNVGPCDPVGNAQSKTARRYAKPCDEDCVEFRWDTYDELEHLGIITDWGAYDGISIDPIALNKWLDENFTRAPINPTGKIVSQ